MCRRIAALPALVLLLLCPPLLAAPATQEDRAAILKQGIKTFQLHLDYSPAAAPDEIPTAPDPLWLSATAQFVPMTTLPTSGEQDAEIKQAEAAQIIDELANDGLLAAAQEFSRGDKGPTLSTQRGYTLTVFDADFSRDAASHLSQHIEYRIYLGFDLTTLAHLDALRSVLRGSAAAAMDQLLKQLEPRRKQWTDEGRVFARDGLALCVKPTKQEYRPGEPIEFDVRIANESDKPFSIDKNLKEPNSWTLGIQAPRQVHYAVQPPPLGGPVGLPTVLQPGKDTNFRLSLVGCEYLRDSGELRRNVPMAALPPGTVYTLVGSTTLPASAQDAAAKDAAPLWNGTLRFYVKFALIQLR